MPIEDCNNNVNWPNSCCQASSMLGTDAGVRVFHGRGLPLVQLVDQLLNLLPKEGLVGPQLAVVHAGKDFAGQDVIVQVPLSVRLVRERDDQTRDRAGDVDPQYVHCSDALDFPP